MDPWHCYCGRKNSYKADYCQTCGSSWTWATTSASYTPSAATQKWMQQKSEWKQWEDPPRTPRRRGKSRDGKGKNAAKGSGKSKGDAAGVPAPWQSSSALASLGVAPPQELQPKNTAPQQSRTAKVDGLLSGLKAHLKAQGKEVMPEVENLLQQMATQGQNIKQASQKLGIAQKEATRLKNELARAKDGWNKFLELLSKEFDQHKEKHVQLMDTLTTALSQAEADMQAAKTALQEAAAEVAEPVEAPKDNIADIETAEALAKRNRDEAEDVEKA